MVGEFGRSCYFLFTSTLNVTSLFWYETTSHGSLGCLGALARSIPEFVTHVQLYGWTSHLDIVGRGNCQPDTSQARSTRHILASKQAHNIHLRESMFLKTWLTTYAVTSAQYYHQGLDTGTWGLLTSVYIHTRKPSRGLSTCSHLCNGDGWINRATVSKSANYIDTNDP